MKELKDVHILMAQQRAFLHKTNKQFAKELDYSEVHVSRIVNDPLFKIEVRRLKGEAEAHEIILKKKAITKMFKNLDAMIEVQFSIANDTELNASARSTAADRVMTYILSKKNADVGDDLDAGNLMVQLADSVAKLIDDEDVVPSEKILKFIKKQSNVDG